MALAPPSENTATTLMIADCGLRIADSTVALPIRNPKSAIRNYSPAPVSYLRSITRLARRLAALSKRRFSSGVSGTPGGHPVDQRQDHAAEHVAHDIRVLRHHQLRHDGLGFARMACLHQ